MNEQWNYSAFSEIFEWRGKSTIKSGDGKQQGRYKMFVCSDTDIKKYDSFLEDQESLVFGTGGKPSCHYVNEPFAYSTDCVVAQAKTKLHMKFYYYYFRQRNLGLLQDTFTGSGLQHTSKKKIEKILVPVLSLPEQARIVARIEELFSQLESGVETLKQTKAQLAVYRQAVLEDAFKGDYSRFALSDISQAISGYAFKSKLYSPSGEYIVVKIGNVKPFRFDFSRDCTKTNEFDDTILRKYRLIAGDCLITLTGSRGKRDYGYVAMIEHQTNYLLNQRVAALRFNKDVAVPQFYQYYLSSREYRNAFFSYETGNVGQGNVGIKALTETKVILPTITQQKTIITEIESRLSVCDQIEQTVDAALQQAEALRQSILKKAFEGGL